MKLSFVYTVICTPIAIINNAYASYLAPQDLNLSLSLNELRKNYDQMQSNENLFDMYNTLIPPFYNKTAVLEYSFNNSTNNSTVDISGCGYCPCLCTCPPKSITCCLPEVVLNDPYCINCSYPDGKCAQCKKGYSLNLEKTCVSNKRCTHISGNGNCNRCEKSFSIKADTLVCNKNKKCTHTKQGVCTKCESPRKLNEYHLCVFSAKKTIEDRSLDINYQNKTQPRKLKSN